MSNEPTPPRGLIAIDVGNSRVKLGWFSGVASDCATSAQAGVLPIAAPSLPEPIETLASTIEELRDGALSDWLMTIGVEAPGGIKPSTQGSGASAEARRAPATPSRVALASVSRPADVVLGELLGGFSITHLKSERAPIELRIDEPAKIGVDRVMAAVAANRLRHAGKPAIVIDIGTAITVDLVAADGALEGGAILPGPGLSARALGEKTDQLPDIRFGDLDESPDAVGRSTEPAMRAGIFWGAVGAIRELIARQRDRLTTAPQVFLTGGAAPSIARLIGGPDLTVRYLPHLTLSGIALAAEANEKPTAKKGR